DIVFVYSASSPADIIFRPELEQLAQVPGVRVEILCSRDSPIETWPGRRGRITAETLAEVAPDLRDRETFVCGPGGYMDAVRPCCSSSVLRGRMRNHSSSPPHPRPGWPGPRRNRRELRMPSTSAPAAGRSSASRAPRSSTPPT